jgi:hypothetical protein
MRAVLAAVVMVLVALRPISASAQQSAVIRGVVSGANGPVAGAVVTLLDALGSAIAAVDTDSQGRFALKDVAPGTYSLLAEAPPRRSAPRVVIVRAALPIDVVLTVATQVAERVTVRATPDAPAATTRMTIAGDALRQLSVRQSSRAIQDMLATLPGWASEDNGMLHVRGTDDGVLYVEDGIPVLDRLDTLFGIAPDPAGIGSMNVLTGYVPPEYGLKAGAVIEVRSSTASRSAWAGSFGSAIGSDAHRAVRASGGGPLGGRASLDLSVASERSDRFLDPVHPDNLHNEGAIASGEAHLTLVPTDADLVKVNTTGGRSRYQVPHGEDQERSGQDQRERLVQQSESASWQRSWSEALVSNAAVYHRRVTGELRGSPGDTPMSARADRRHDRVGMLASVTHVRRGHTMKLGVEAERLALREAFQFAVTNPDAAEAAAISERAAAFTPAHPFVFQGHAARGQYAVFAQDSVRATDRLTLEGGLRFDSTRLLVPASQWSPRAGVAYTVPGTSVTVRASVNRLFQPPQPEYLLLSSSPAARALSPFAGDADAQESGGADVPPERQTAWEIGIDQRFGGRVRLDAAYWSRQVRNYADPNVFFGTTIIFPNSVARGTARGLDLRFEMARYRGWSSYASYTLSKVEQIGPINGGLFLEDDILEIGQGTRFTPDHDQRHVSAAGLSYQSSRRGFSASIAMRYGSGTPLETDDDDAVDLMTRPGAGLADFDAGRVRPHTVFDCAATQTILRARRAETSIRVTVLNLTNRAYALNFGNPFSGTHFGAPRTVRVDVDVALR